MSYASRLHEALTVREGNIHAENLFETRDAAELSHSMARINAFVESITEHLAQSDIEDFHDVERALTAWQGIDYAYTYDLELFVYETGIADTFRHHHGIHGRHAESLEDLYATAHSDLTEATRSMVTMLAAGIAEEPED